MFLIKRVLYSFLFTETMATFMGISLVGGMVWRRANRWGALASLIAAFGTNFLGYHLTGQRMDHWSPNVFLAGLLAGVFALVVVSLLTPAENGEALASFFSRLDSPADKQETVPKGSHLLLVNLLRLNRGAGESGLWRAYRTDWIGLIRGFALVLGLVACTWLVFRL